MTALPPPACASAGRSTASRWADRSDAASDPLQISANAVNRLLEIFRVWPRITTIVAVLLLAAPFAAEAQPSTTIPRIGLLADATSWEPLRLGLRDLGYVEGKSIALEERSSQGRTASRWTDKR